MKKEEMKKYTPLVRLAVMLISMLGYVMTEFFGWEPIPWTNEEIGEGIFLALSVILAIYNWFTNQPVTHYGRQKEEAGKFAVGKRKDFKQNKKNQSEKG